MDDRTGKRTGHCDRLDMGKASMAAHDRRRSRPARRRAEGRTDCMARGCDKVKISPVLDASS